VDNLNVETSRIRRNFEACHVACHEIARRTD
jgi:hypothetical protein